MKIALHPDTRQRLPAADNAPATARCPHCGGVVTLRHRRRMDRTYAHFWRHGSNQKLRCNGRGRRS